ncbi:hypothetical protein [uncultured Tenacibaculum sp.]|uniref:hypothetical protein n=1 Tax=uncultured Tenacibaculum sp. TaxID=174713 RepID=UPI00260A3DD8|nr:hypothetical protein [uncultured Tenacibaculum sp.]
MKKSILNLGKILNKAEQKVISGGVNYYYPICECDRNCNVINNGRCEDIGCPMQEPSGPIGPGGPTLPVC